MPLPNKYLDLRQFLNERGEAGFRYQQILDSVFKQGVVEFSQMNTLPLVLRDQLVRKFGNQFFSLKQLKDSRSSQAHKLLFEVADGHRIETVAMRYRAGWHSVCLSTQSGCGFGCRFCATAAVGLNRNLSADEICDQVLYFRQRKYPIDSISFMGMGEALANPNIFNAVECLTNPDLFAISPRRLTISTIGLVPAMRRLSRDFPQVNMTFSLHSPFNQQRSELIPLNRKYQIENVMDVLDEHVARTHRKVYIAYLLLKRVNDSEEHANALAKLLVTQGRQHWLFHVNLVRHNSTIISEAQFDRPSERVIRNFRNRLERSDVNVTVRPAFGIDINAACGQLYGNYALKKRANLPQPPPFLHKP